MTRARAGRALAILGVASLALGCAAAPLPAMRPLAHQSPQDLAWDSRTCAWAAEDASGYWADLSPPENGIMAVFAWGPAREPAAATPTREEVGPASPSPAHLGRGGRGPFVAAYEQCMLARGYERSGSPAADERDR